jgi:hypothetical protein
MLCSGEIRIRSRNVTDGDPQLCTINIPFASINRQGCLSRVKIQMTWRLPVSSLIGVLYG